MRLLDQLRDIFAPAYARSVRHPPHERDREHDRQIADLAGRLTVVEERMLLYERELRMHERADAPTPGRVSP